MSGMIKEDIVIRNEEIAFGEMDGEIVMMNIEIGNYYSLGKTGSAIWNLLDKPIKVESLINEMLRKYNVTREQCEKEVISFLEELKKEGLIIVK